jgi:cell division initiation protein
MLTPQEVNEKVFPKSSFGGYNMTAVDEFLDALTEDYTALYKENAVLKSKMKVLAEKVEEYRETEDAMRSTLLTAQKMATALVKEAEDKKKEILAGAVSEASKHVEDLDQQTRDAEKRLAMAKNSLVTFLRHSVEICEGQTAFLKALPEMDLPVEEAPAQEAAETPDMRVEDIEKSILNDYTAPAAEETAEETAEAPAAPTSADEPAAPEKQPASESDTRRFSTAASKTEENPFPTDFKMSLDELKFGRNYNSEDK